MIVKMDIVGYRFACRNCGEGFDDPDVVEEDRGEFWGMPAYEEMWYCPCCGSDDFDEAEIVLAEQEEGEDEL